MNKELVMGTLLKMRHEINELITHINGVELKQQSTEVLTFTQITQIVAGYYGVIYDELVSGKRLKEPASSAKHVAIYLCTVNTSGNTLTLKHFFNMSAYQSIYYANDIVNAVLRGDTITNCKTIQHIKKIDIETLTQYINEKFKQPHIT